MLVIPSLPPRSMRRRFGVVKHELKLSVSRHGSANGWGCGREVKFIKLVVHQRIPQMKFMDFTEIKLAGCVREALNLSGGA